jgi:hypothetical protein
MEKTFIDHYLLGNFKDLIATYLPYDKLQGLNPFEKCLLIDAFIQVGQNEEAKRIYELIKLEKDAYEVNNIEQ